MIIIEMDNKEVIGRVALRMIEEGICEMKRLYLREAFQGCGVGKSLVGTIINEAKKLNYDYMRLDTLSTMEKAQSLYRLL